MHDNQERQEAHRIGHMNISGVRNFIPVKYPTLLGHVGNHIFEKINLYIPCLVTQYSTLRFPAKILKNWEIINPIALLILKNPHRMSDTLPKAIHYDRKIGFFLHEENHTLFLSMKSKLRSPWHPLSLRIPLCCQTFPNITSIQWLHIMDED